MKTIFKIHSKPYPTIVLMIGAFFSTNSHAYPTGWSTPAAACTPSNNTSGRIFHASEYGTVSFNNNATGTAYLTCAIPGLFKSAPRLHVPTLTLNYYDGDGLGDKCHIKATLLRGNSEGLERGRDIVSFISNQNSRVPEFGTNKNVGRVDIPERFNLNSFDSSVYWVQLELYRFDTTCNATATGVSITYRDNRPGGLN